MFTSGLQECSTDSVQLHGVSPGIMLHLMQAMYTGQICISEEDVCSILTAASMYQVGFY